MRRLAAAAAVLALLAAPATAARGAEPEVASLAEAVRGALETGEGVRIAAAESRKAALRTRRYRLAVTPDVRLQALYQRLDAETVAEGGGGGTVPDSQVGWSLTLTQPLYTGGRATAAYRAQREVERSTALGAELARRATALAAAEAWFGLLASVDGVGIAEDAVAQARRHLERAAKRVELGEAVLNDRLQAEVSLRRLEADLAAARGGLANAREAVRRLTGRYPASRQEVPAPFPPVSGAREALVAEALAGRLEPRQARHAVAAAEQDVREKRGRFLPSLALTATYGRLGEELDALSWQWNAGVALDLPLYESGQRLSLVREARAGLEQAQAAAEAEARDVERDVLAIANDLEAAAARIESLRTGAAAATEALRLSERRYEVGLADSLEVVDAQVSLTAARTGLAAERYRREVLTLRLADALGRDPLGAAAP